MKAPKLTKKDKRTHAEKKMDDLINSMADNATDAKSAGEVLDLMKKREDLASSKAKKVDPNLVLNLAANTAWIVSILHTEQVRSVTSKAMNFVFRGRLR